MKSIIVYYSHEGNTQYVAEKVAKTLGSDLLRLEVEKDYPEGAPKMFFWGGKIVHLESEPELKPYNFCADEYDLIILGTPVWIGTYAPPIKTFLKNNSLGTKKIALLACHGGGGATRTEKLLKKQIPNNPFLTTLSLDDPLEKEDKITIQKEIESFCTEIKQSF